MAEGKFVKCLWHHEDKCNEGKKLLKNARFWQELLHLFTSASGHFLDLPFAFDELSKQLHRKVGIA